MLRSVCGGPEVAASGAPRGARESEKSGNKYAIQKQYSFPADRQFVGVETKTRSDVFVHHLRTYGLTIPMLRGSDGTISLNLPDMYIDAEKVSFPKIIAKRVTENGFYSPKG